MFPFSLVTYPIKVAARVALYSSIGFAAGLYAGYHLGQLRASIDPKNIAPPSKIERIADENVPSARVPAQDKKESNKIRQESLEDAFR